ncbi:MAG: hypothetical protein AAGA62_09300, partial [Bacteroidota bacterium]
ISSIALSDPRLWATSKMRILLLLILLQVLTSCSWMTTLTLENDSSISLTVSYLVFSDWRGMPMDKVEIFGNSGSYDVITSDGSGHFTYTLEPGDQARIGWTTSTTFEGYHHQCSNLNKGLVDDCIPVEYFVFRHAEGIDSLRTDDLDLVLSEKDRYLAVVSLNKVINQSTPTY